MKACATLCFVWKPIAISILSLEIRNNINLGKVNQNRNYRIFEEFTCILMNEAWQSCYKNDFEVQVDGNVYAFDSSTIDLCLSVFWWAEFRKYKGGIKLHNM